MVKLKLGWAGIPALEVKQILQPLKRAFVLKVYALVNLLFPFDGSSVGYSTVAYARSQSTAIQEVFQSRIPSSRCKI